MPAAFHRLVVLLSCTALVACTSLRTVIDSSAAQVGQPAAIQAGFAPNDSLIVTTRDGAQTQVQLATVTQEFIEGTQDHDKPLRRFALSDVVKIERREFDGLKTAFLVMAIAAGVYAIAKAAAEASLASNI